MSEDLGPPDDREERELYALSARYQEALAAAEQLIAARAELIADLDV